MKKILMWGGVIVLGFGALIIVGIIGANENKDSESKQTKEIKESVKNIEPSPEQEKSTGQVKEYEIIDDEDISYLKCKRFKVSVVVPRDTVGDDIRPTAENILSSESFQSSKLADQSVDINEEISIFFWDDKEIVGKTGANVAQATYGSCNKKSDDWQINISSSEEREQYRNIQKYFE